MELFRSDCFYIFVRNESSLWWNRQTGAFSVRSAWDLSDIEDIECLGITEGIIGKVELANIYEPKLMIIKESEPVGQIYFHHTIHKIKSVTFLQLGLANQDLDLSPCTKHGSFNSMSTSRSAGKKGGGILQNSVFLKQTVGAVKNVSYTIKTTTQHAATQVKQTVRKQRDPKVAEKFEKRLTDELHKIFDDSDSFYYSRTLDLTNSLQRQYEVEKRLEAEEGVTKPVSDITRWWKYTDDRFFWNKHMLKDIMALESPQCDEWVLPIIQGYVKLSQINVESELNPLNVESLSHSNSSCDDMFTLGIITRRSRYQAGTRYNRRGVETCGKVANYVETEQIVSIVCTDSIHRASFVQVRGSVPIFWSQPDLKFRPPMKLERSTDESYEAFKNHFEEELSIYKQVCIVNLVEQQGRERIIWRAYSDNVIKFNDPNIIYVTFDFHEYCRGMHYENVSILINALSEIITEMKFCWRDDRGVICTQEGVFRVNCIDCLDRTNVVQTAIAKYVLELQLCRLGLGTPGVELPAALKSAFLSLWADSGDYISRQYAGTRALKGDYTRTGERKISGMMKDGVASANRYYLSTFKDALRQVAIDVMTGESKSIPEQLSCIVPDVTQCSNAKVYTYNETVPDTECMAQHVKSLIDDCKKLLVDSEPVLGSWGLIDADPSTGDPLERELDAIVVLTGRAVHVAHYDETADRLTQVYTVPLGDVSSLQIGVATTDSPTLFGVGLSKSGTSWHCIRINYRVNNEEGYYHMFRSTSLRFFNNMAVVINTHEEMIDIIVVVARIGDLHLARELADFKPTDVDDLALSNNYNVALSNREKLGFEYSSVINYSEASNVGKSLHSICESIRIARDVANLPPVPFHEGVKFDKKKSKVPPNQSSGQTRSSVYLDLSRLPTLTKNVGETQLVADIRSVGSKALTNMSEQFSKLNRLGARAKPSLQLRFDQSAARSKKIFTLGAHGAHSADRKRGGSDGMSSDYSSDDENRTNIFEPTLDNFENNQVYIGKGPQQLNTNNSNQQTEDDCELIENPLYSSKIDTHEEPQIELQNIVNPFESTTKSTVKTPSNTAKINPFDTKINIDYSQNPQIHIDDEKIERPPSGLFSKLSQSSSDINIESNESASFHKSNSQHEISLNIAQSHSESALRQFRNLASPVSLSSTKDMVMSPLSKIAKGVQSLSVNLDPRKKQPLTVNQISEQQYEEHRRLHEAWKDCKSKLIAL